MVNVIDMTPALKQSYDFKKMKRDLYAERRSCRDKMRLAQGEFLVKTTPTKMDAFLPKKKRSKKK